MSLGFSQLTQDKDYLLELSYEEKIEHCKQMIKDFVHLITFEDGKWIYGEPYIAFSGGKDSCVLAHMIKSLGYDFQLITSTEMFHPEIPEILKYYGAKILPSKMSYQTFIKEKGVCLFGKKIGQDLVVFGDKVNFKSEETKKRRIEWCGTRYKKYKPITDDKELVNGLAKQSCCNYVKGDVKHLKQPSFVGTTIYESDLRKQVWRLNGCNVVSKHQQKSTPLSILKTEEIWRYIKENNIKVSKAYEMGWKRTGCLMCQMGIQFKAKRQELLLVKKYYPTIWEIYKPYFEPYWIKMGYKELYE